jgi:hypothetical protein
MNVAHSMCHPITCVVLPLGWCDVCQAHRPAAGGDGEGWRCAACGELRDLLHAAVDGIDPAPGLDRIKTKTAAAADTPAAAADDHNHLKGNQP